MHILIIKFNCQLYTKLYTGSHSELSILTHTHTLTHIFVYIYIQILLKLSGTVGLTTSKFTRPMKFDKSETWGGHSNVNEKTFADICAEGNFIRLR